MAQIKRQLGAQVSVMSFEDWMVSCGIFLDRLVIDLNDSDIPYGTDWQEQMRDQAHLINVVGRRFYDEFQVVLAVWKMNLPEDVGAVRVVNPYYDPTTEEPDDSSPGSSRDGLGELPF